MRISARAGLALPPAELPRTPPREGSSTSTLPRRLRRLVHIPLHKRKAALRISPCYFCLHYAAHRPHTDDDTWPMATLFRRHLRAHITTCAPLDLFAGRGFKFYALRRDIDIAFVRTRRTLYFLAARAEAHYLCISRCYIIFHFSLLSARGLMAAAIIYARASSLRHCRGIR